MLDPFKQAFRYSVGISYFTNIAVQNVNKVRACAQEWTSSLMQCVLIPRSTRTSKKYIESGLLFGQNKSSYETNSLPLYRRYRLHPPYALNIKVVNEACSICIQRSLDCIAVFSPVYHRLAIEENILVKLEDNKTQDFQHREQ
jgi:hypothetical protein